MADPIEDFFTGLARRGYEPLLKHDSGSIRFDLQEGGVTDHWRVAIDKGKVTVEHEDAAADTVLSQDRATLVDAIEGSQSILISVMLGRIGIVGNAERMVRFQRLFGQQPEMATTATGGGSHG